MAKFKLYPFATLAPSLACVSMMILMIGGPDHFVWIAFAVGIAALILINVMYQLAFRAARRANAPPTRK